MPILEFEGISEGVRVSNMKIKQTKCKGQGLTCKLQQTLAHASAARSVFPIAISVIPSTFSMYPVILPSLP